MRKIDRRKKDEKFKCTVQSLVSEKMLNRLIKYTKVNNVTVSEVIRNVLEAELMKDI